MYKNIQIRNALECVPWSEANTSQWVGKVKDFLSGKKIGLKKKIKTTVKECLSQHWFSF